MNSRDAVAKNRNVNGVIPPNVITLENSAEAWLSRMKAHIETGKTPVLFIEMHYVNRDTSSL